MDYLGINKNLWNNKTKFHFNSEFYDVPSFLEGRNSLNDIELSLLGNIAGKHILHLQCHFGQDTISLNRMGAFVTGVDFAEEAINRARQLNEQTGSSAEFIVSDIYSLPNALHFKYDIVFASYGVIGWHPNADTWMQVASNFLKPGGKLVFIEFHPVVWMFSYDFKRVEFNYSDTNAIVEELEGTYTDRNADIKEKSVSWNHGLGTVVQAVVNNNMMLTHLQEYNYSPYACFENTIQIAPNRYQIKSLEDKIPLVYSLIAEKK